MTLLSPAMSLAFVCLLASTDSNSFQVTIKENNGHKLTILLIAIVSPFTM